MDKKKSFFNQLAISKDFAKVRGVFYYKPYKEKKLPCIKCGQLFILPFAEGNEKGVICEDCNRE